MKEKILNRATDLFLNLGFKSVTMDDIAQEMGISKKTIYSHFPNKTKLIEQCTAQVQCDISEGIDEIVSHQKNPIEELYEIKRFVMMHLKNEKKSPGYQLQKYYPEIYKTLNAKQFEIMHRCIVDNIERGLAMGIYRDNLNIQFVSRIYFSGISTIKDDSLFPTSLFSKVEVFDYYLEYHLRGIVTPKGRQILNTIINSNQE